MRRTARVVTLTLCLCVSMVASASATQVNDTWNVRLSWTQAKGTNIGQVSPASAVTVYCWYDGERAHANGQGSSRWFLISYNNKDRTGGHFGWLTSLAIDPGAQPHVGHCVPRKHWPYNHYGPPGANNAYPPALDPPDQYTGPCGIMPYADCPTAPAAGPGTSSPPTGGSPSPNPAPAPQASPGSITASKGGAYGCAGCSSLNVAVHGFSTGTFTYTCHDNSGPGGADSAFYSHTVAVTDANQSSWPGVFCYNSPPYRTYLTMDGVTSNTVQFAAPAPPPVVAPPPPPPAPASITVAKGGVYGCGSCHALNVAVHNFPTGTYTYTCHDNSGPGGSDSAFYSHAVAITDPNQSTWPGVFCYNSAPYVTYVVINGVRSNSVGF